jgi:hypothetical protein
MAARKGAGPEAAATDLEARETVGIGNAAVSKAFPQDPQAAPKFRRAVAGLAAPDHFQPAKTDGHTSHFLQIVAKPKRATRKKPEPKLTRVAFRVSRLMEFCTRRELQNQTGHGVEQWPLCAILDEHGDLRWDDAVQIVLDKTQLDRVRTEKQKAKKKSGDFTDADENEGDDGEVAP